MSSGVYKIQGQILEDRLQGPLYKILRVCGTFLVFHVLRKNSAIPTPQPRNHARFLPSPTLLCCQLHGGISVRRTRVFLSRRRGFRRVKGSEGHFLLHIPVLRPKAVRICRHTPHRTQRIVCCILRHARARVVRPCRLPRRWPAHRPPLCIQAQLAVEGGPGDVVESEGGFRRAASFMVSVSSSRLSRKPGDKHLPQLLCSNGGRLDGGSELRKIYRSGTC